MNRTKTTVLGVLLTALTATAQNTNLEIEQLTVNEQVTTHITASEPIRYVDISTDKGAGDQPIENTIRLKPKEGNHADGEVLAIVTIVTERYRTQYGLIYTTEMGEAVTDKEIQLQERNAYRNREHEHRGHVRLCQKDMEQPSQVQGRSHQAAQDGDAPEQHLCRGRLFLH